MIASTSAERVSSTTIFCRRRFPAPSRSLVSGTASLRIDFTPLTPFVGVAKLPAACPLKKGQAVSVKVEDALGARKFGDAGACNGTLDVDLTLASIRQAQPGATSTRFIVGVGSWSLPDHAGSGPGAGPPTDSIVQSPSTTAAP
jgi:hypothetical protein